MIGFGSSRGSGGITSFANRITNTIVTSFGCPSLNTLGLNIGSIINMIISNKDEVNTELKDITLQTSTYNKIIPEVFGLVHIAGNLMWCSEIKKTNVYHPQKVNKNGVQSAYSENFIRASFAVAICKGEVDEIKNVYADGELLNLSTYNIKIYKGDEKQTEDPTMQSYLGMDIPAFRGLCYAVFTDFPMEEFYGRIPNLTFDVVRKKDIIQEDDMESLVSAINIIPGSGEFVYDTITQKKNNGNWLMGNFYQTEKTTLINNHSSTECTDSVDSLNDLQCTFPNLNWVSLVVCWFCDNTNSDDAFIFPAAEKNIDDTEPGKWSVDGKTRLTCKFVGKDENGNIRYGGTPSDDSVIRFAKEIKSRGLKLCLYPMLMVDTDQKPWRGHITGSADKIHDFFVKKDGYNNFIKHYVNLLNDQIDAVIIGSEMKGLTSVRNEENKNYPAVDEFCNLADEIRNIIKPNVKITYAADWSEYHHDNFGIYNLDKLWACKNIDYIGIDAYFPLTDKAITTYDIEEIKNGWRSGEGWDFYYADEERTKKDNLSPEWAWKNVEYFWENYHYNPDGTKTEWEPKSKKIWFTEYGFPSVDCCTNQPNVFYSRGSLDSSFPRNSTGTVDFKAQRVAITASELAWKNSECVEEMFLYTWDARPYPHFPNLKDIWSDAYCWEYGHFMNGKSGFTSLANVVNHLCKKAGLKEDEFDVSLLKGNVIEGYVLNDKKSILSHLKTLAAVYNFDAFIDGTKIYFKSLKDTKNHIVDVNEIIVDQKTGKLLFELESVGDTALPSSIELLYVDASKNYSTSTAIAKDNSENSFSFGFSVPVPMSATQAQEIVWRMLSDLSNQKMNYLIRLPISFLKISPLDTITINYQNQRHLIRVKSIDIINGTEIQIIGNSVVSNDNIITNIECAEQDFTSIEKAGYVADTNFELFELYNINNRILSDTFVFYCAIWSNDKTWNGASIYCSDDNEQNYYPIKYVDKESSVGMLISFVQDNNISPNFIDKQTSFFFSLLNENRKLYSITDDEFFQMKNKILIGDEIIAFRDVRIVNKNIYKISYLLRGRFNTEEKILSHKTGDRVILLDDDVVDINIPFSQKGKTLYIKAVSYGDSITNVKSKKITLNAFSNIDYDVKNFNKSLLDNGDILLSFSVRKNYKLFSKNNTIITNNLLLTIKRKDDSSVVRQVKIQNDNKFVYTKSMQIEDFSKEVNVDYFEYSVENLFLV